MGETAITDALVEALAHELARLDGWQDPNALWTDNLDIIARGGEGAPVYLDYVEDAQALVAGPLAPLLAAHQQVTAERDAEKERADRIDAKLRELNSKVAECLPPVEVLVAEREAAEASLATATSELARLRAEGEAKDRALKDLRTDAAELGARLGNASQYDDRRVLRDLCWEAGNFLARRVIRTALARAATAREGA